MTCGPRESSRLSCTQTTHHSSVIKFCNTSAGQIIWPGKGFSNISVNWRRLELLAPATPQGILHCFLFWSQNLKLLTSTGFEEVSKQVEIIQSSIPNPYILLILFPHLQRMALDLKDASCCLPLAPVSQPIFAFEWTDQEDGYMDFVATGVRKLTNIV